MVKIGEKMKRKFFVFVCVLLGIYLINVSVFSFDAPSFVMMEETDSDTTVFETYTVDINGYGLMYDVLESGEDIVITGYVGYMSDLVIPDAIDGYMVKEIAPFAFSGNSIIKTATISGSIKSISEEAFSNCINLKKVVLQKGTVSIEKSAFLYCTSLSSVQLPDSLLQIQESAFEGCGALGKIVIPASVTQIGQDAFFGCADLLFVCNNSYAEQYAEGNRLITSFFETSNFLYLICAVITVVLLVCVAIFWRKIKKIHR